MNNPYLKFVESIESGLALARRSEPVAASSKRIDSDSKVLLFSPHPDDECVTGLLPLRLMREAGKQIINVPVTFGSKIERQAARSAELQAACSYLGWDIHQRKEGYPPLTCGDVLHILQEQTPEIIFVPHADDWNSRHVSTHELVMDSLSQMSRDFSCKVIETEFWKPMHSPNLMIEGNAELVAELVAATSLHAGEVARNPYHLLLPSWMQDNVRRGTEIVGGQGGAAPDFTFATLYRLRKWEDSQLTDSMDEGLSIPVRSKLMTELF